MKPQFRKIVIGIDFSDASLAGARWVATHLAPRAELLLVHVVPVPKLPVYLEEHVGSTIDQRATLAPRLYTALRGFAEVLGSDRVRVGIRTGVPWSALARVAYEVKADLICVGRGHGRQGSSRFGATTPQRLLGVSHVPVLVIPQGIAAAPDRVIAALSGRPGGEHVIPVAQALASRWRARLDPLHIIETDVFRASAGVSVERESSTLGGAADAGTLRRIGIDGLDQTALQLLASSWITESVAGSGSARWSDPVIRLGDPGPEVIAAARETEGSPLIVIGRLGESVPLRASRGEYRCGSTTRMVLWAATCPVMVVPTERGAAQRLSFVAPNPRFDALVPRSGGSDRLAMISPEEWSPRNGGDAA
jgi:nucleotide-binding universal stress UspA family protein